MSNHEVTLSSQIREQKHRSPSVPVDMDSLIRDHSLTAERLAQLPISLILKGFICNENSFYQRLV